MYNIKISQDHSILNSPVLRGLMSRPTDKADRYLNYGLTNRLFKSQEEYLERKEIGGDILCTR